MRTESVSGSKRQEDPDSQHSLLIQQGQAQAPAHKEKVWASQPKGVLYEMSQLHREGIGVWRGDTGQKERPGR